MATGTYTLAASMVNQLNRVDTISNNLANLNTNGFKQDGLSEGSFNNYLKKATEQKQAISKYSEITNTIPKLDSKYIDKSIGNIVLTGNNTDFSLKSEETFFKLQDNNGNRLLTRDGAFKVLDGFLVSANGYKVLNNDNEPIVTDEGFESQIAVVKSEFKNLEKTGNNNFKLIDSSLVTPIENAGEEVLQGSLEKANVNQITAMISLIDANRRFDQAQKAIQSISQMNSTAVSKIGNNR